MTRKEIRCLTEKKKKKNQWIKNIILTLNMKILK